jgi:phosphate transport system substrate-binding protein
MGGLRRTIGGALAVAALVALAGCGDRGAEGPPPPSPVRVDGSSTLRPLSQAMADSYQLQNPADQVVVAESGTTGGFRKFCAGETDIADASRPIHSSERAACFRAGVAYVEAPVAFDAITIIAHPSNPIAAVTLADLRAAWQASAQGAVTNWRQINPTWPSRALTLFGPGADSGTYEYFNLAVLGEGSAPRTDYQASEDDAVIVEGVAGAPGGMGYVGLNYYLRNQERLKALPVDGGQGPIAPSAETALSGQYHPLARPLFIYVSVAALQRPEVQRFAEHYIANARRTASAQGYIPLPGPAYDAFLERLRNRTAGTAFSGAQTAGATIEQVIARPLVVEAPAE